MRNPITAAKAVVRLKAADKAMDAYFEQVADPTVETTQSRYLYLDVEDAYDNPALPDRYRDPRDRT